MSDSFFPQVVLLAGFAGVDAATAYTEESTNARAATFAGNAQLDDDVALPWGTYNSLLLDGSGDSIHFGNNAAFAWPGIANSVTVECWIRATSFTGSRTIFSRRSGGNNGFQMSCSGGNLTMSFWDGSSAIGSLQVPAVVAAARGMALNTWCHVAVSQFAGDEMVRLWVNGYLGSMWSSGLVVAGAAANFFIGRDGFATGREFAGNIAEFRWTNACRYTRPFAPPIGPWARARRTGVAGGARQPIITGAT